MAFGENIGSIEYVARIDTGKLRSDAADVDRIAKGAGNSLGDNTDKGASRAEEALARFGKRAAIALGVATAGAVTFGVKSSASFEQTRIGLENMLGSAEAARSVLSNVSKFAAETPFEFPELASAVKQLVAFGFSGQEAFTTMKQLGDVSAAIGAPIGDLSYLMGTLRAQGRAFTIDIRQFAQRGVPIYKYLAQVLGTNTEEINKMIEAGKIGFPEVQRAFAAMTAEGGAFHGAMAKQSKSLSGLFSTLKDNIGQTTRELIGITQEGDIKAGSLFDKLRTGTATLIQNLPVFIQKMKEVGGEVVAVGQKVGEYLGPKLTALWATIRNDVVPAIASFAQAFGPAVGAGLVAFIGLATDGLNLLMTILGPVIQFLADHTSIVWAMVGAFAAWKAVLFIDAAVGAFRAGMLIIRAESLLAAGVLTGTTGAAVGLRGALLGLLGPWQIVLGILGVAAVIEGLKEVSDWLNNLMNKWDKAKGQKIPLNGKVSVDAGSDAGLAQRFINSLMGRASGGPVRAGQPYIVGEKRPELFIPNTSGTIVPEVPSGGGIKGAQFNIGTINISNDADGDRWLARLTRNDEITSKGLTPGVSYNA